MAMPSKNQHLVPDSHTCKHCGLTKLNGRLFTVSFIAEIPYFRPSCNVCRMVGTNTEQFNVLRETKIALKKKNRIKNSKRFKGYFKNKRYKL